MNQNRITGDEKVSLEEFLNYYNMISFLIEKDEDFNNIISKVWGLNNWLCYKKINKKLY